jgi:GntP family gluconate:H+ symporter
MDTRRATGGLRRRIGQYVGEPDRAQRSRHARIHRRSRRLGKNCGLGKPMEHPIMVFAGSWAEPLTFLIMLAGFGLLVVLARFPIGLALLTAAWIGALVNGSPLPLRHLVEGAFSYLDPILVIATAMILMRILADGGALRALGKAIETRFGRTPLILLPLLMLIIMFPGMITGSSTASVLTTGAMAASILGGLGLSKERAAAVIAMGGVLGMVAPPVNIPAMIIGGGIDLPYSGFDVPLAFASFPLAILLVYGLAWPALRKPACAAMQTPEPDSYANSRIPSIPRALLAPLAAALMMLAPRIAPDHLPDLGLPMIFLTASAIGVLVLPRFALISSMLRATEESLPVLGILCGVGAFIQIMTWCGSRGWLVSLMTGAPSWAIFAAAAVSIPLFGAVSAFGSASVLGVPFLLALLGRNEIVTTAALSLLTALGDLMLPAALAATLAAQVTGAGNRMRVLRLCITPALVTIVFAVLMLIYAPVLGRWLLR